MATTQTIDATIFASSHPDIAKRNKYFRSFILFIHVIVGILVLLLLLLNWKINRLLSVWL